MIYVKKPKHGVIPTARYIVVQYKFLWKQMNSESKNRLVFSVSTRAEGQGYRGILIRLASPVGSDVNERTVLQMGGRCLLVCTLLLVGAVLCQGARKNATSQSSTSHGTDQGTDRRNVSHSLEPLGTAYHPLRHHQRPKDISQLVGTERFR